MFSLNQDQVAVHVNNVLMRYKGGMEMQDAMDAVLQHIASRDEQFQVLYELVQRGAYSTRPTPMKMENGMFPESILRPQKMGAHELADFLLACPADTPVMGIESFTDSHLVDNLLLQLNCPDGVCDNLLISFVSDRTAEICREELDEQAEDAALDERFALKVNDDVTSEQLRKPTTKAMIQAALDEMKSKNYKEADIRAFAANRRQPCDSEGRLLSIAEVEALIAGHNRDHLLVQCGVTIISNRKQRLAFLTDDSSYGYPILQNRGWHSCTFRLPLGTAHKRFESVQEFVAHFCKGATLIETEKALLAHLNGDNDLGTNEGDWRPREAVSTTIDQFGQAVSSEPHSISIDERDADVMNRAMRAAITNPPRTFPDTLTQEKIESIAKQVSFRLEDGQVYRNREGDLYRVHRREGGYFQAEGNDPLIFSENGKYIEGSEAGHPLYEFDLVEKVMPRWQPQNES